MNAQRRAGLLLFWLICCLVLTDYHRHARAQTAAEVIEQQAGSPTVTASIDLANPGRPIPPSFIGLSLEYYTVPRFTGTPASGVNMAFTQLLMNLAADGNGAPVLRIGGNSQDESWWNAEGAPRPAGVSFDITPDWMSGLSAAVQQTGSGVILGLNLGQDNPQLGIDLAAAAQQSLSPQNLLALEIGNEPDLFATHQSYVDDAGQRHFMRSDPWGYVQFQDQFTAYAAALQASINPLPPLAGPSYSCNRWTADLPAFFGAETPALELATRHIYALTACGKKPGDANYPNISQLLADRASHGLISQLTPSLDAAHSAGLPLRIAEMNSVSCGGARGVSDSAAAALWAVDLMFELANAGADGVNFHNSQGASGAAAYNAFTFGSADSGFRPSVRPLYYGLLLFARATGNGARLLPVAVQTNANVKIWATLDDAGTISVVLLNKDEHTPADIRVQVAGLTSDGALALLIAPSPDASTGITFDGQTFDGSTDGRPLGAVGATAISPAAGAYTITLPAASAGLLTLHR